MENKYTLTIQINTSSPKFLGQQILEQFKIFLLESTLQGATRQQFAKKIAHETKNNANKKYVK